MRRRAAPLLCLLLALGLGGAWLAGDWIARRIEAETGRKLALALEAAGLGWARGAADGLAVTLSGEAPDPASRAAALALAVQIAGPGQVRDATSFRPAPPPPPPPPRLDILRDGHEVTLTGSLPADGSRERLAEALASLGEELRVTDRIEPVPAATTPDWPAALALALRAATALPRAQVSLGPCRLEVSGVAPDGGTRAALLDALRAAGPCLAAAEILAPKPLVSPYRFDLGLADGVPVLAACAVPTPNGRARILEAVRALGPAADAACAEASGAPSERWTEAVLAAVRALGQLGAGRVRITDSDVRLEPSPGLAGPLRLRAAERLAAALPPGFALAPPKTGPGEAGLSPDAPLAPALFIARRRADGLVKLIGTLPADSAAQAVSSYAAALFGTGMVAGHMGADPSLPDGWIRRVMAGLDALALLAEGELRIEETFVALSGRTLAADAEAEARRLLGRAFGPDDDLRLAIRYDAAAAEAARAPRPDECLADMLAELSERQIQFPPGSSAIAEESRAMLDRLAEIIRACAPARFEIGGHTDTSGPADGNLALSQARADSVVDALLARGVDLDRMAAKGYGEAEPIADNSTEAGRALNRRIGLKLLFPADGPH